MCNIVRKGSSYYGYTYYLVDGSNEIQLVPAKTENIDAEAQLSSLAGQSNVTITGYLIGLSSAYSYNYWYMTFSGTPQIPTQ
jgi:hypothetical protein